MGTTMSLRPAFGARERCLAGELFIAWAANVWASGDDHLEDDATVELNPTSGFVYLVDRDYNVAMLNGAGKRENWLSCGNCGEEGLRNEVEFADESLCAACAAKERSGDWVESE